MFIQHLNEITKAAVQGEGIAGVCKQIPIGPAQGWKDYVVRVFTLQPGGHTPHHAHDWEHINYVISGNGQLDVSGTKHRLPAGTFAVVPANEKHQYSNPGAEDFVMICIVPARGEY